MISYVFINGLFSEELSNSALCPKNITIEMRQNAINLHIPKNIFIDIPIRFHFISQDKNNTNFFFENNIFVDEGSQVVIVEEYTGEEANHYKMNVHTTFSAGDHAKIHYYKIQKENKTAEHKAFISFHQKKSSLIKTFFADFGGNVVQENVVVNLEEDSSACHLHGLYCLRNDNQQLLHHIIVNHSAPHGKSDMLYKGILDKKSQAIFHGKFHVHPQAKRIEANQGNHNLLLSSRSEVQTKPELEIYAEDVKCKHGATVGQLDEDALFYLRARGISEKQAIKILTQAFAADIIEKVDHAWMRETILQEADYHAA